ncbi:MAG: ABC transporter substrate-binding protein [Acetobacteraceae bacterium]
MDLRRRMFLGAGAATAGVRLIEPRTARGAEQQLLYLAEDVPAGLDYDGPSASTNTSQVGFLNLLEPLVGYPSGPTNAEGIRTLDFTKFEGRLVESWDYDAATLTWTLHLRRGVKSCAGNIFSADDVIFTFARAKSASGATPVGWFLGSVASVKGFTRDVLHGGDKSLGDAVTKVDDYTVQIRQSEPNHLFLTALAIYGLSPFDSQELKKHVTPEDPWGHTYVNTVNAPGFGAYCLERWTKGDEFVLRANPDYYRGKPAIDRVVIKKVPQSANRALTLRAGEAQLTQHLTAREFDGLRKARGVTVAGVYGNETLFLNLNFKTPPFDNPKLRQAFAAAMPYAQIAQIGYAGQARKWDAHFTSVLNGYVKPATQYARDVEKAKQLLTEAGFPGGKGLEKYADSLKLTYVAERESQLGPIATVIRSALQDAAIQLQLDPLPQTEFKTRSLVKKDLPMSLLDTEKPVGPDVVYATMLFFVSPAAGGINNMANYANPDVDRLFAALRGENDPAKRLAMLTDMQETIQRDLAWIPTLETKTQWAFNDKLHGITWYPDNGLRFFDLHLDA